MDETHVSEANYTPVMADSKQEAFRVALALYDQAPDWVTFFREVLGVGGIVRRLFPDDKALLEFEKTEEHAEIQGMLARLRQSSNRGETREPIRVITVRLPQSLHEALQAQAQTHQTSMNKLCISKLLHVIDGGFAGPSPKPLAARQSVSPQQRDTPTTRKVGHAGDR